MLSSHYQSPKGGHAKYWNKPGLPSDVIYRHHPMRSSLTNDIIALATKYGRYGYRRITALLNNEHGWKVNHKRVERIWRREGLKVPKKQPRRGRLWLNDGSCIRLRPEHKDHVWSYDFMVARTSEGRAFRILTILGIRQGVPGNTGRASS